VPDLGLVFVAVFAVNLLPAFGPPTWALLVLFRLHLTLSAAPLIAVGAAAAASGRVVLALGARAMRRRFSPARQERLDAMKAWIVARPAGAFAGLLTFAVSPVPSGQLFVGAGLVDAPLRWLTPAFFAGRVVSYTGYVTAATLVDRSTSDVILRSLRSPVGITVQLLLLGLLALLPLIDWTRLDRRAEHETTGR
jgi:hypothetical protein